LSKQHLGLAMTGGGARGAYQAGVLKRLGEIPRLDGKPGPFSIIGAASAGAVNGTALATGNQDFKRCTQWTARLWENLQTSDVYRTDIKSMAPVAGKWLKDLGLGAVLGGGHAQSLLDASPLHAFLNKHLKPEGIQKNINSGNLRALCITATNYNSGKTFLFIQGEDSVPLWMKSRRIALATKIHADHVCASAAIPIVFQPVKLSTPYGTHYYGDGCLRMMAPLSPVIRLGASKILAIGVRSQRAAEATMRKFSDFNPGSIPIEKTPPPVAQIIGVTLNSIFLDHLDTDIEHLERLNRIITQSKLDRPSPEVTEPLKIVKPVAITPSEDIGQVADSFKNRLPPMVRFFLAGLGTKKASSADLISYLLFDTQYTRALVDLGYKDASAHIDEVEDLIFG
jgi:NTE family protein